MLNIYKIKGIQKYLPQQEYNPHFATHGILIKKHMVVCGGTGTGKSSFLTNYINQLYDTFQHIYIFTKDVTEEIYVYMKDGIGDAMTLELIDKVPSLKEIKKYESALIVFDDFICCNKSVIQTLETYSIMARKHGFTCIYLTQSYFKTPITLRQNCRYLTLLALTNKTNSDLIVGNLSIDLKKETIKKILGNATKFKMNCCLIDMQSNDNLNKTFRRNFNDYYTVVDDNLDEIENVKMYETDGIIN